MARSCFTGAHDAGNLDTQHAADGALDITILMRPFVPGDVIRECLLGSP